MTSFAFILGVVPLMLATGAGAEMRQSLGITVFFGMLGVTGFGLIFTPVFCVACRRLDRANAWTRHAPGRRDCGRRSERWSAWRWRVMSEASARPCTRRSLSWH
jgi:hypothetical protein